VLTVGSLFAGIGGFDLGFERAGMRTLWQVEQNEFCRRVLERHFPAAHRFNDVRTVTGCTHRWDQEGGTLLEYVDVLCGGFPCQDISSAGAKVGIGGERSGLWSEYARLIGELRPRYVVVENVSALLARGLGTVLGDLAEIGYDAEWDCLPASAFGAPHRRDRIWLVAYPHSSGQPHVPVDAEAPRHEALAGRGAPVADPYTPPGDAEGAAGEAIRRPEAVERPGRCGSGEGSPWAVEPDVGRVANGVPARMDRLGALGNALVPQIAEFIGRRIIEWEGGIAA
jgi:DNA (cytosine-5)-methyltransferase 1